MCVVGIDKGLEVQEGEEGEEGEEGDTDQGQLPLV